MVSREHDTSHIHQKATMLINRHLVYTDDGAGGAGAGTGRLAGPLTAPEKSRSMSPLTSAAGDHALDWCP